MSRGEEIRITRSLDTQASRLRRSITSHGTNSTERGRARVGTDPSVALLRRYKSDCGSAESAIVAVGMLSQFNNQSPAHVGDVDCVINTAVHILR